MEGSLTDSHPTTPPYNLLAPAPYLLQLSDEMHQHARPTGLQANQTYRQTTPTGKPDLRYSRPDLHG
eukprot:1151376-Pelagomonas_calceolata.AAC.1